MEAEELAESAVLTAQQGQSAKRARIQRTADRTPEEQQAAGLASHNFGPLAHILTDMEQEPVEGPLELTAMEIPFHILAGMDKLHACSDMK